MLICLYYCIYSYMCVWACVFMPFEYDCMNTDEHMHAYHLFIFRNVVHVTVCQRMCLLSLGLLTSSYYYCTEELSSDSEARGAQSTMILEGVQIKFDDIFYTKKKLVETMVMKADSESVFHSQGVSLWLPQTRGAQYAPG